MDLLDNKLMPDPYQRDNLLQFYQFEYDEWEYKTTFDVSADILGKQVVELVCEGLDTHATIYLNSKQFAITNNTHRTWVFDASNALVSGKNDILINFASAASHDLLAS